MDTMDRYGYRYASDWSRFAFPEPVSRMATNEDIRRAFTKVDTSQEKFSAWGLPLCVEGKSVYLNDNDENVIIFGETGSKKTRCAVLPLLALIAGAGGSVVTTDVKGELCSNAKLMAYLGKVGVNVVRIDFRTFDADGYNIFEYATKLYCAGKKDKAMANVSRVISALLKVYENATHDPYWHTMADFFSSAVIEFLLEICAQNPEYTKYVNVLTLSAFSNENGFDALNDLLREYYSGNEHQALLRLKSIVDTPERTRNCIMSVANSMIKDIIIQPNMTSMLSNSTFELSDLYEKPTFVFLVVPDETSAYDIIASELIDIFYAHLVEVFTEKYQNKSAPPCDIAWICEEMCNVQINDARSKLSACRSRHMRFFLICQSLRQLEQTYQNDSATIIGNCKNQVLLQSSDIEMLRYFSTISGVTTISDIVGGEPLLPIHSLKHLKKTWEYKEAIFVRDDLVYFATLPDFDQYEFLREFDESEPVVFKSRQMPPVAIYTPRQMLRDIRTDQFGIPFKRPRKKTEETTEQKPDEPAEENEEDIKWLQRELERKFDELFGHMDEDDDED